MAPIQCKMRVDISNNTGPLPRYYLLLAILLAATKGFLSGVYFVEDFVYLPVRVISGSPVAYGIPEAGLQFCGLRVVDVVS